MSASAPFDAVMLDARRSAELAVVREMLAGLDALTPAGQRHVMEKVTVVVEGWSRAAGLRLGARTEGSLAELMGRLQNESRRAWPDAIRFTTAAEDLLALIAPPLN